MTTLRLPENIEIITEEVVNNALVTQELNKKTITEIIIPEGVTVIGDDTFDGYTKLSKITLPTTLTMIGARAFQCCSKLTDISLPGALIQIDEQAFLRCESLKSVIIPDRVNYIGREAFYSCIALTKASLPKALQKIEVGLFKYCESLIKIIIPEGVAWIEDCAFAGCTNLIDISLPGTLTTISEYVFMRCTSLVSITIPNGVHVIGSDAFNDCTSLIDITLPERSDLRYGYAFKECTSLSVLIVPDVLYITQNEKDWKKSGLNPITTKIISAGVVSEELYTNPIINLLKTEYSRTMLNLMYYTINNIYKVSQIKAMVNTMRAYDFFRSLLPLNKTLITDIKTGSQALPSVTINWKKLDEINISINYKNFDKKKQTDLDDTLNIPLNLFSEYLTVGEMQNFIVGTELIKTKMRAR